MIGEGRKRFEFFLTSATDSFINMDQDLFEIAKFEHLKKEHFEKRLYKIVFSHIDKFHFSVSLNILEK